MAAPVVSGIAAILLSMGAPPEDLLQIIRKLSTTSASVEGLVHPDGNLNQLLLNTKLKVASLSLMLSHGRT
ncbi:hypothetical protein BKA69DRAFT_1095166 [Paraphysoderma sedebokerense]|nr:hypothetical protein BKA69DRAFT_1095166 [Paraphysoderma sedebokerense]